VIRISLEALRCLLARRGVTFQRTKTWKESPDRDRDAKLDRIGHVLERFPDRVFAFDEFGPLGVRPTAGSGWAPAGHPERHPATYHRTHGVRYFHGCYSIGNDTLLGRQPPQEGHEQRPGRTQIDPRGPPGPHPELRHPGQPLRPQGRDDPLLGQEKPRRAVLHPDLRVVGQPDRSPPLRQFTVVGDESIFEAEHADEPEVEAVLGFKATHALNVSAGIDHASTALLTAAVTDVLGGVVKAELPEGQEAVIAGLPGVLGLTDEKYPMVIGTAGFLRAWVAQPGFQLDK
jgi:hypothetical protein